MVTSIRESAGGDKEVCKQKTKGGKRIQNRGLSTAKYKRLKMANKGEKIREIDSVLWASTKLRLRELSLATQ